MQLNADDQSSYNEVLCSDISAIISCLSKIDVENSEAWNPLDKERIFGAIRATPEGMQGLNVRVMAHMRNWVLSTAQTLLDRLNADPDYVYGAIRVSHQLSLLYKSYGEYEKALRLCQHVVNSMENLLGPDHEYILSPLNNLAALLQLLGRYDEAEALFRRAYVGKKTILGDDHKETMRAYSNLATALQQLQRHDEAVDIYRQLYQTSKVVNGADDEITINFMSNLAMGLVAANGDIEDILLMSKGAYEASARTLGESHPSTAEFLSNYGTVLLEKCGRVEEAVMVHRQCLAIRERVLGCSHSHTLETLGNLATALRRKNNEEACKEADVLVKRIYATPDHDIAYR